MVLKYKVVNLILYHAHCFLRPSLLGFIRLLRRRLVEAKPVGRRTAFINAASFLAVAGTVSTRARYRPIESSRASVRILA